MNRTKGWTKRVNAALCSASVLALSLGTNAPAFAQDTSAADDEVLEEITITGIRSSLSNAILKKRNAKSIVDAIGAEDIGRLPDTNIAEALQRVTGVQIQRDAGEGSFVSIRGLDPIFTKVTIDGQSVTSARTQRFGQEGFNFATVAPSIASSLEVIKSPTANLDEGGVGGTVNISKRLPLDIGEPVYSISAEAVHNELRDKTTPRITGFVSNTFADDTIGVSLTGYYYERRTQRHRIDGDDSPRDAFVPGLGDVIFQENIDIEDIRGNLTDLTFSGAVQYRPQPGLELYADATYTDRGGISQQTETRFNFRGDNFALDDTSNFAANADGHLTSLAVSDYRQVRLNPRALDIRETLFAFRSGGEWDVSDSFNVKFEGAYSKSTQFTDDLVVLGGNFNGGEDDLTPDDPNDTVGIFTFGVGDSDFAGVTYQDPTGLYSFGADDFEFGVGSAVRELHTDAEEYSLKVDARKEFSNEFALQYGAKYTNVTESQIRFRDILSDSSIDAVLSDFLANIDSISSENGATGFVPGVGASPFFDVADIALDNDTNNNENQSRFADGVNNQFFAERDIYAGYVMVDFNQSWGDLPFSGNIGLRVVHDRSTLRGFGENVGDNGRGISRVDVDVDGNVLGGFSEIVENRSYTQFLPSFNLKLDVREDLVVRLAGARVMRRPEISDQTPFFEVDFATIPDPANPGELIVDFTDGGSGRNGNPDLLPFLANQFDFSVEYYTGQVGLLSVGLFYKDVENFIDTEQIFQRTLSIGGPDGITRDLTFDVSQSFNGGGATVKGFEATVQRDLNFLPVKGFGISVNYTFTDSNVDSNDLPLPGTSKHSGNGILYFENERFGARIAHNYRSRFRSGATDFRLSTRSTDASAFYNVTDNVKLQVSVVNLFDQVSLRRLRGSDDFAERGLSVDDILTNWTSWERNGRQIFFGASATF